MKWKGESSDIGGGQGDTLQEPDRRVDQCDVGGSIVKYSENVYNDSTAGVKGKAAGNAPEKENTFTKPEGRQVAPNFDRWLKDNGVNDGENLEDTEEYEGLSPPKWT